MVKLGGQAEVLANVLETSKMPGQKSPPDRISTRTKRHNMRITTIAWTMLGTAITLFSLTGVCVVMLNTSEQEEMRALQKQAEFKQLGIDLADASDYLTNEVPRYTQFGEKVHFDNYWREVRETRTRDRVVQRLGELDAPPGELDLISLAKHNSDALIAIEEQAMAAVARGDLDAARHLVFNTSYDDFKRTIMEPSVVFSNS